MLPSSVHVMNPSSLPPSSSPSSSSPHLSPSPDVPQQSRQPPNQRQPSLSPATPSPPHPSQPQPLPQPPHLHKPLPPPPPPPPRPPVTSTPAASNTTIPRMPSGYTSQPPRPPPLPTLPIPPPPGPPMAAAGPPGPPPPTSATAAIHSPPMLNVAPPYMPNNPNNTPNLNQPPNQPLSHPNHPHFPPSNPNQMMQTHTGGLLPPHPHSSAQDFFHPPPHPGGYPGGPAPPYGMPPPGGATPYVTQTVYNMPPPFPTPQSPAFSAHNAPPAGTVPGTPAPPTQHGGPLPPPPGMPGMPPQSGGMPPQHPQMPFPPSGPPGNPFTSQMAYGRPPLGPHMPTGMMNPALMQQHHPSAYMQQPHMGMSPMQSTIGPPGSQPPLSGHMSIGSAPTDIRGRIVHQEIKLEISAKGLWDRDLTSKSDPTCVVFLEKRAHAQSGYFAQMYPTAQGDEFGTGDTSSGATNEPLINWYEVGRTECIKNNLNPHFKVQVTVPYHFERLQHIRLGLWDIDSKKQVLESHDFLGDVRTTVAELVMARVWTASLTSTNIKHMRKKFTGGKRNLGTVTVIVHEDRDGGNMLIKAAMAGKRLDRKDFFLTSDPYFIVTQLGKSNASSRSQLYKSEVIRRNVNPLWRPFQFKVAIPKGGGKSDINIEFLVYDKDNHRRDDEIGKAVHPLDELEKVQSVPVINESRAKKKRKSYRNSGMLEFSKFQVIHMPSLVDYLQGGLKLHFSVAVDLTASNGNPREPNSLHYFHTYYGSHQAENRYTRALSAIANVLEVYCPSENLFAAYGFGAELPGNPGYTSSCFPLGLGPDPMCHGIHGIRHAYMTALSAVRLSGPTNFAPLIETASRTASQRLNSQTDQNYDVLLIMTDGVVSDFDLTVDRIISASHTAPLSIIIIGIGNRNFRKMKDLDSDDVLLQSSDGTRQAARDICHFVDFSEYEHASPEHLVAAVLAELPGNIVEYFVGVCDPPISPGHRQTLPIT